MWIYLMNKRKTSFLVKYRLPAPEVWTQIYDSSSLAQTVEWLILFWED